MFCKNCGAQNPDDVKFCQSCGSAVGEQPANPDAGAPAGEQNQPVTNGAYADPAPATLSMKWHKFLVYFALWAGALINLVNGLQSLSGSQYGEYKGWVYALFSGLQAADMAYGVVLLVCAALGCFVAYSLLKMKKGAPKLLMILYAVSGAGALIYSIAAVVILAKADVDLTDVITNAIATLIGSIIILIINFIYYKKREHLFIH